MSFRNNALMVFKDLAVLWTAVWVTVNQVWGMVGFWGSVILVLAFGVVLFAPFNDDDSDRYVNIGKLQEAMRQDD